MKQMKYIFATLFLIIGFSFAGMAPESSLNRRPENHYQEQKLPFQMLFLH
jgi:hypothetical protein